jgi:hypothetical protein
VQPSSLIFLVIIAIWAAYFIQHWVRRREHLATARSVDRFSESMRVLEHRSPLPAADLSVPQPRSYAVSPARPARPEILVKRAAPSPLEAPLSASGRAREAAAGSPAPAPVPSSGRRARGLTFLGSLATLLVTVGLVSFGVVPWPAVFAPIAAIAAVMVWMRRGAEAERAARRGGAGPQRAARPQRERRDQQASSHRAAERAAVARESAPQPAADAADAAEAVDADDEQPVSARESFYDIQAVERGSLAEAPAATPAAAHTAPAAAPVDEDDIPLTWDPVPVPRPTYTMKAMAHRVPAPPVAQGVPPELAEPAYEEPVRRVAGA